MGAVQYIWCFHSNKTSLAKRLPGTVEPLLTANLSTIATSLQQPLFLFGRAVLVADPDLQKRGGGGGRLKK